MLRNILFGRPAKPSPDVEEEEEQTQNIRPSKIESSFREPPYKKGNI